MTNIELKSKLEKSIEFLKSDLMQVRTGRATPSLVEDVAVDAYGSKMTIKELGSITLLDNQNLIISPWDRGLIQPIGKAIRESELKLNPIEDSDKIRVPVPSLTEERRKEFTKLVSSKVEEAKNSMRNVRQDAMKDVDKEFADKLIGEDDKFRQKEEIEKIVKEFSETVEELGESKKEELLTI